MRGPGTPSCTGSTQWPWGLSGTPCTSSCCRKQEKWFTSSQPAPSQSVAPWLQNSSGKAKHNAKPPVPNAALGLLRTQFPAPSQKHHSSTAEMTIYYPRSFKKKSKQETPSKFLPVSFLIEELAAFPGRTHSNMYLLALTPWDLCFLKDATKTLCWCTSCYNDSQEQFALV